MLWCSGGSLSLGGTQPPFLLMQPKKLLGANLPGPSQGAPLQGLNPARCLLRPAWTLRPWSSQAQAAEEGFVQSLSWTWPDL